MVVTNHAMLAIDALSEARLLPEVDVIVVDEAHELADRATNAVTDELTAGMVERAARRCRKFAGDTSADLMLDAAAALASALESTSRGPDRRARPVRCLMPLWRCATPDTMP